MHADTTTDGARRDQRHAAETDACDTLVSLTEAAAALGLRPATIKQYIQKGQLAAIRVPCGKATRLFVARAEIDRYRHASLGGQGWLKRRERLPDEPTIPTPASAADTPFVAPVPRE